MHIRRIQQATASAIATGSILLSTFVAPAFATSNIEISGNGASSVNTTSQSVSQTNTVVQNNNANVTNTVSSNINTGSNRANDNTGGDVSVRTGNAVSDVNIRTDANMNQTESTNCNCDTTANLKISGNGADSNNQVNLSTTKSSDTFQSNNAQISNNVNAQARTGNNDTNRNTNGDVLVVTGHASSDVTIKNTANTNVSTTSHGSGSSMTNTNSAWITGNGADSDNRINLNNDRSSILRQDNTTNLNNDIDSETHTGSNRSNDNTGGDVVIDTGHAMADITVDNMAGFNAADTDCGCVLGTSVRIGDNGSDSDNRITSNTSSDLDIFQDNRSSTSNIIDPRLQTGANESNRNTGDEMGDSYILTGHADEVTEITNRGNANMYGNPSGWELPGGWQFAFHFDLSL